MTPGMRQVFYLPKRSYCLIWVFDPESETQPLKRGLPASRRLVAHQPVKDLVKAIVVRRKSETLNPGSFNPLPGYIDAS